MDFHRQFNFPQYYSMTPFPYSMNNRQLIIFHSNIIANQWNPTGNRTDEICFEKINAPGELFLTHPASSDRHIISANGINNMEIWQTDEYGIPFTFADHDYTIKFKLIKFK